MSIGWLILIIVLAMGFIIGNVLLLKSSSKFHIPKGFQPRKWEDDEGD
ncbi:DUF2897 family protein [Aestuariibacter sp. A3R04]|nr:DUF2897 family protein [Aestuariibacter sp. A3R04]